MLEQFDAFMHRTFLQSKLPPATIAALTSATTPNALKALLLRDEINGRLIDHLFTSNDLHDQQMLGRIAKTLTDDDWFQLLTINSSNGINAITYWMNKNCEPLYNIELMLTYLQKNDHKVDILTRTFPCNEPNGKVANHSLFTHPQLYLKFSTLLRTLSTCSDEEKRSVLLSVAGGEDQLTPIKRASETGQTHIFMSVFSDPKIVAELTDLSRKYYLRTMATHFLGLHDNDTTFDYASNSAQKQTSSPNQPPRVTYEGVIQTTAMDKFKTILGMYRPSIEFRDAFSQMRRAYALNSGADVMAAYEADRLVVIGSGWTRHSIYIGAMQDYLVVANRGQGMHPKGGCIIYRLNKPLTLEDVEVFKGKSSQAAIEKKINEIVKKPPNGMPDIVVALPSKGQKYGTCSIANQKALVDGLLALLNLTQHPELVVDPQTKKAVIEEARNEYKRFTQSTRLAIVNELIEELVNSNLNRHELIEALSDYCNQHFDTKKKSELAVLTKIVKTLPPDLKADLLKKVKPSSRILLWHLENSQTIPGIVENILSGSLYSLRSDEDKESFTHSYEAHLNQQFSEEEAIKWFTVYFNQAMVSDVDVLAQQITHLSHDKMISILMENNANRFTWLLTDRRAEPIVEQVLKRLSSDERKQILTPSSIFHIKKGSLLKLATNDLDDEFVLYLLNNPAKHHEASSFLKREVEYMPLSGPHDETFFRYIEERFGKERFMSMVRYVSESGIKSNILIGARHSPGAVNFILDNMPDDIVADIIEESKSSAIYGNNLLSGFAESFLNFNPFAPKAEDLIFVLNRLVKNQSTDKIKAWLSEIDNGKQSFLHSVLQQPALLPFYLTYFSADEISLLIKAFSGNFFAYPNAKAIYDHLYARLPENEFKALISHNLPQQLERVLSELPWCENYLKQLIPNEVNNLVNQEPEKYLATALDNPSVIDLVTVPHKWEILANIIAKSLKSEFNYSSNPEKLVPLLSQIPAEFYPVIAKMLEVPNNLLVERLQSYNPDVGSLIALLKLIPAQHRHLFFNRDAMLGLIFAVPQYASEFIESGVLSGTPELAEIKALLMIPYSIEPRIFEDIAAYVKTGDSRSLDLLIDRFKFFPDKQRNMLEKLLSLFLPVIPLEQRPTLLQMPEFVSLIRDAKLLSVVFEGKSQDEVFLRLLACFPTVLSLPHTLEYLQTLNQLIGNSHFKDLLNPNMLALFSSKPEEFSFLERHFSEQILRDYVSQYKHSSADEQNFLGAMLAKHYAMGSQDIGDSILENIQLLCNRFSKEEVKAWLLEKDLDGYNAIVNALHDEKLFNFITTFFTPAELTPLLIDADNNWLRAARTYPRTHVFQYLENHLSPVELARFLEPDLETTIKGMLATKQRKSLEIVLKNVDPQKARQILKTHQALVAQSGIDVESLFARTEPKRESRAKPLRLGADPAKVEERVDDVSEIENIASTSNQKSSPNIK